MRTLDSPFSLSFIILSVPLSFFSIYKNGTPLLSCSNQLPEVILDSPYFHIHCINWLLTYSKIYPTIHSSTLQALLVFEITFSLTYIIAKAGVLRFPFSGHLFILHKVEERPFEIEFILNTCSGCHFNWNKIQTPLSPECLSRVWLCRSLDRSPSSPLPQRHLHSWPRTWHTLCPPSLVHDCSSSLTVLSSTSPL